jgi:ABC-2 type transport system permease protein
MLIARHEYRKITRKRTFLLGTIGMPLFIVAIMAFSIIMTVASTDRRPLGYVDHAGVLTAGVMPAKNQRGEPLVEIRAYADEAVARSALEAKQIQAYYVLPVDYVASHAVELYYWDKSPAAQIQADFTYFLRANLVTTLPKDLRQRALDGIELTARSADGRQEISGKTWINMLMPFMFGLFFVMTVMGSGSYLLQAVTDEKENRTVEIMTTTVTPEQLIGGKALGLIAVALTQIALLAIVITLTLIVGARFSDVLSQVRVPWPLLLTIALYFLPSYALIAGMMIAVGSAVTELRQGQQIVGVFNLLFTLPYFFVIVFFTAPDSTLSTILTLFPTTSFITITMRWGMTTIPVWQLIVSWLLLAASSVLMVWAAARIFRVGMLRYGQRLTFKGMVQAVRVRAE